ncbi:hypothetical protein SO802_021032 [Lithocarpus litseifolius]|uniref:Gnk2-homologous domain-containing protein n=1 Tax=Lithocarpus litseifolius TaxID=425828 RepID=A0AAW2CDK3_9ROSI
MDDPYGRSGDGHFAIPIRSVPNSLAYLAETKWAGTKGQGADIVYGLAICRGDIFEKYCKSCTVNATNEIRSHCPNNKGAIIWYYYTLKYHNLDFFGQIGCETLFLANTPKNMNTNQLIRQKKGERLAQLAGQASVNAQMFSTEDFDVGDNYKFHGSIQCPRDLSSLDCMKCLNDLIGFIPKCCDLSKGVQIFSVTCDLRFETFYHKV